MQESAQELMVIREVLEGMLAPEVTAAVLFTALDSLPAEPSTADGWADFVRGPLRDVLRNRTGEEVAGDLIGRIGLILGDPAPGVPGERSERRSQAPTGRYPTTKGPTRTLVVASGGRLARLLKVALGNQIVPMVLNDPRRLVAFVDDFAPMLLVVDVTDPARFLPSLPDLAEPLDPDVIAVIWDEGTETGQALTEGFEAAGRRWVWVNRHEGVDPIIDLVRASRA